MIDKINKLAAYVRISSDKQDTQRQEERIKATGQTIDYWFRDNIGKNPRDLPQKRPAFQRLLKSVQAGQIQTIIVDRQDRFGVKDAYQLGKFISLLRENDCKLIDADGKILSGDDDLSILSGTLGAITSTREQKEKAHRNLSGKILKAKLGEYQGGYSPYGLDVVCYGADGKEKWRTVYVGRFDRLKVYPDGKREKFNGKDNSPRKDPTDKFFIRPSIVVERIKIIKQIFKWFATEDISCRQIATRLYELKIDPVQGPWEKERIRGLLINPAFIGLPTFNKKGGSRFIEFINGKFQAVTSKKQGRKRNQSDYIAPDKPLYKPIIDIETWNKVQAKLERNRPTIPNRSADTESLYLRAFLYCGKCGKPMHATRGGGVWPSYFCGTYAKHGGLQNPTGCHCHRVKHSVIEKYVSQYLKDTDKFLSGDASLTLPLVLDYAGAENRQDDLYEAMFEMVGKRIKEKGSIVEIYGKVFDRIRPKIEQQIQVKENALERMIDDFRGISEKARPRINQRVDLLQGEIDSLKSQLIDLRQPVESVREEVKERKETLKKAFKMLSSNSGRQRAEALHNVLDKIVCHFRYVGNKSYLDKVEIVPISSENLVVTGGNMPGLN